MKCSLKKYSWECVLYVLVVAMTGSCTRSTLDNTPDYTGNGEVLSLSTRAPGNADDAESAIRTLRLFIFSTSDGSMLLNKLYKTSEANPDIPVGTYSYFARVNDNYRISELIPKVEIKVVLVANELIALSGSYTLESLKGTVLNYYDIYGGSGTMDITIDGQDANSNKGYIPMYAESDGLTNYEWNAGNGVIVDMPLKRTLSKVILQISKEDGKPNFTNSGDKLTISGASVMFIPMYSYLGDSTLTYEAERVTSKKQDFSPILEITPMSGSITSNSLVFYLPERILSDVAYKNKKYTYIQVYATYYSKDEDKTYNSTYKIALGNGVTGSEPDVTSLSKADLSIGRNKIYNVQAKVTTTGKLEILQVKVEIAPWGGTKDVVGDITAPLLNITKNYVEMSQKVVRVHFWSNLPDISLEAQGKKDGGDFDVNTIFKDLVGSGSNFKLFVGGDADFKAYNGYMDLEFLDANTYNQDGTYTLTINAGGLKRTVTVIANPKVGEIIFDANGGTGSFTHEVKYVDLNGNSLTASDIDITVPMNSFTPPAGKEFLMWVYSNGEVEVPGDVTTGAYKVRPTGYTTKIKAFWKNIK